jgi:hypothetical protein
VIRPSTPLHRVLDVLEDLRERLNRTGPEGADGSDFLRRYRSFIEISDKGRACTYAMKCKELFLLSDYHDIKELLEQVQEAIELYEALDE